MRINDAPGGSCAEAPAGGNLVVRSCAKAPAEGNLVVRSCTKAPAEGTLVVRTQQHCPDCGGSVKSFGLFRKKKMLASKTVSGRNPETSKNQTEMELFKPKRAELVTPEPNRLIIKRDYFDRNYIIGLVLTSLHAYASGYLPEF